ncbi:2-dehydropantoate 2-reductase [Gordonia sp. L191]|uniref:ketopantoate reductase family protein n=1 Tax=unclassified Gordonia (in: high G+C Gram-positive bacteria) TaxID=2657482 RepID=UPI001119EE80|nr:MULTISPECIES: 2-dehydropantoate 2-reductase [unclassified Gordonia (in: high G+C Gram-positive bacteria)]MDF3281365.1 2-dehydropantoate 2-reductase [Gordonia sp. N1V]WHU47081.1 2-dehydropantoate 2-reductase [Gordonia sp. L191]
MNIVVVGAGALGLYFAAKLAAAPDVETVTLVARSDAADRFANGEPLVVDYGDQQRETRAVTVVSDIADVRGDADLVVVTVKSWQVPGVAELVAPLVGPRTLVMTVQNGVDAPLEVAKIVGSSHVVAATCVVIAQRIGPLTARCLGRDAAVEVGPIDHTDRPSDAHARLATVLLGAGLQVTVNLDMRRALWRKLMLVASYGGVGALCRQPTGVTATDPITHALVEAAMREVAAVACAHGVHVGPDDVTEAMSVYVGFESATTSSMQRDLLAGRPSELFEQNGAVLAYAEQAGVEVPVHRMIVATQSPGERLARSEPR